MDLSNNIVHDLDEMMYYYQRNIRDYMDNIHEYNHNVQTYLNIIRNPHTRDYITYPLRTQPNLQSLFRTTQPSREEGTLFSQRFEDVVIRPTNDQITRALENYLYLPGTETHTCPITLDPIQEGEEVCKIRHCGHIFKRNAIMGWFQRNVRCPVCRYDIRDYTPVPDVSDNEFEDLVREFAEQGRAAAVAEAAAETAAAAAAAETATAAPFSRGVLQSTLTNAIRSFVNQELQRLPVNDLTTELLYTFDIPLTLDTSGNYRL